MKRRREHPLDVAIREMATRVLTDPERQMEAQAFAIESFPDLLVELRVGVRQPKNGHGARRVVVVDRFGKEVRQ